MDVTRPKLIDGYEYNLPVVPPRFVNIEDAESAQALMEHIINGNGYIAFDTETNGLGRGASVFGVSFTVGAGADGTECGNSYWYRWYTDTDADVAVSNIIRYLFGADCRHNVIMHNGKFDMVAIYNTLGISFDRLDKFNDTMIMNDVMRRFPSSALKTMASWLYGHTEKWEQLVNAWFVNHKVNKKDEKNYEDVPECIMFPYACNDTELTFKTFFELRKLFSAETEELQRLYMLERQIVIVTAHVEYKGMLIDTEYFKKLGAKLEGALQQWNEEFVKLWGPINFNSPPQVAALLYGTDTSKGQLGLPVKALTKSKNPSTDADALEQLAIESPIVGKILSFRRCAKALSTIQTFMEKSLYTEVGRTVHTSYYQILETGRFSSQNPNLQNIINDDRGKYTGILPDGGDVSVRQGFICPDGFVYVKCDYAAFELRILGNACGDKRLNSMILAGVDMHSWLAAKLYSSELDRMREQDPDFVRPFVEKKLTETEERYELGWKYRLIKSKSTPELVNMRTNVKVCSFEIVYGAGPKSISERFHISIDEAARLRSVYFTAFPIMNNWRNKVKVDTERTKFMFTLFGRKRKLESNEYAGTVAVNHVIQGTAADILKMSMLDLHHVLKGKRSYMCATIHDEFQFYIHHTELDVIDGIVAAMETRRSSEEVHPLPMKAEVSASRTNWHACRELNHSEPLVPQLEAVWKGESK